jgi:predicted double-glycine peptidase
MLQSKTSGSVVAIVVGINPHSLETGMEQFRLLTRTRQVTEYSCGACALQAVLGYWGRQVDEEELMKLLHTTSEEGTYPEDIVRVARGLGFEAEAQANLLLDDVQKFTANGQPMIALAQVWRSGRNSPASVAEDWDSGHYIVILAVDQDYVYFQDPYAHMGKAFIPRKTFVDHWHQVMGGDREKNPKLMQLGIFVRGNAKVNRTDAAGASFSTLDFGKFGSLNLIITQFSRVLLPYDFLDELRDVWATGQIRPDAFIFLRKDRDGNISGLEGSRLTEGDDVAAINAVIAAIASRSVGSPELAKTKADAAVKAAAEGDFGLSLDDIKKIAQKIPPDHTAIILLIENAWERKYKEVAKKYGGAVVGQRLITPDALANAARGLAAS